MTQYSYHGGKRLFYLIYALLNAGMALFFCFTRPKFPFDSLAQHIMVVGFVAALFGGGCWIFLYILLDTFAVFTLDGEGVQKRSWNGRVREIAWRELALSEPTKSGSGSLVDRQGEKIRIPSADEHYRSVSGRSLHADLADHLAHLPKEAERRIMDQQEFRAGDASDAVGASIFALVVLGMGGFCLVMPAEPKDLPIKIGMIAFFVAIALLCVWGGVKQATRVLTLTNYSLVDRSLFGRCELPFAQIVGITNKEVATKSSTIEVTRISSAGKTITITSRIPNYDRLVQSVQAQVGDRVVANAPEAIAVDTFHYRKANVLGMCVVGFLIGLGFYWLGNTAQQQGQAALQQQKALNAQGKHTTGELTDVKKRGNKAYILSYRFQVDGKSYFHSSRVSSEDYADLQGNKAIAVDYLPNDPEVSRVAVSMATEQAEDQVHTGRNLILASWIAPLVLIGLAFTLKPSYRPTSAPKTFR